MRTADAIVADLRAFARGATGATGPQGASAPLVVTATSLGIYASTDSAGPAIGPSVWTGATPQARAAHNTTQFNAWKNSSLMAGTLLLLDKPLIYEAEADVWLIPSGRVLDGNRQKATLKIVTSGRRAVGPASSPAYIQNLNIDGGGSATNGSDSNVDYIAETMGTFSPNVAGSTLVIIGCTMTRARDCAWHGRNAGTVLIDNVISRFVNYGLWSEACSECIAHGNTVVGTISPATTACGLFEGSGAGTATRSGETMVNGGLWRMRENVSALGLDGWHFNGVAGGNLHDSTCEGSSQYSYRFTGSTGITCHGLRSNAGNFALFDDSITCEIQGHGVSTQQIHYRNNARQCYADVQLESFSVFVDLDHVFGTGPQAWTGQYRGRQWYSKAGTAPTEGYWELGTPILRRQQISGQSRGWLCSFPGNPNGGTGAFLPDAALP